MKARNNKKDANSVFFNRMLKGKKKSGKREKTMSPMSHTVDNGK